MFEMLLKILRVPVKILRGLQIRSGLLQKSYMQQFQGENLMTILEKVGQGFNNVSSRRVAGFLRLARHFELNFFIRKKVPVH